MSLRLAVLTNELPPYRRPIFEMLAEPGDIEVVALLNTAAEEGRTWSGPGDLKGVDVRFTRSVSRKVHQSFEGSVRRERTLQLPFALRKDLAEIRPDVILSGEFGPRSASAALYARKRGIPLVLWSEETEYASRSISFAQRLIRKWLFRRADAFVGFGGPACAYLKGQGIPEDRIFACAQAIDHRWWTEKAELARKEPSTPESSERTVLSVGQLVPRKGFDVLLRAWSVLPESVRASSGLAIAGEGPDRGALQDLATALGVADVRFLGALPPEELAVLYSRAHVFVLPTLLDVWGLVVNEAMACGTPVLCSLGAGAAEEMIDPGVTGDVFDPGDSAGLSRLLERWLNRPPVGPAAACVAKSQEMSFERTVEGIRRAVRFVAPS